MAKKGTGIHVVVKNDNLEAALRVFSRKVKDSKLILEIKQRQFFEKKSAKARRKRNAAINRHKRESELE